MHLMVIQGQSQRSTSHHCMLALALKIPKIWWPKLLKTGMLSTSLSFEVPNHVTLTQISICMNLKTWESLGYILTLIYGYNFFQTSVVSSKKCITTFQSLPGSMTFISIKSNYAFNFLLVMSSNIGPISHHFWDMATHWFKIANFQYTISVLSQIWGCSPYTRS